MKKLEPISYATEPRDLDDILAALDAMAVEALAKIVQQPGRHSSVDPGHAKLCNIESAIADMRVSLRLAS